MPNRLRWYASEQLSCGHRAERYSKTRRTSKDNRHKATSTSIRVSCPTCRAEVRAHKLTSA